MSGQSQDLANMDYGLGTGTGTGGIGHELGTSGPDTGGHGRTGHRHGYKTRHGHGRTGHGQAGHGRAGHGRIVSERHGYPLVSI
jgi:hypothetical protein